MAQWMLLFFALFAVSQADEQLRRRLAPQCNICRRGGRPTKNNGIVYIGLDNGNTAYSCNQLYEMGQDGDIPEQHCQALGAFIERDDACGCTGGGTGIFGDFGSGDSCFSASTTVEVQGKGVIRMDQLEIGDRVQSGDHRFSQVHGFYHIERTTEADYLAIETDRTKEPLEISANHLIFVGGVAVTAGNVKVGDRLGDALVTDVTLVKRNGIYAPATYSGTIMVNGVLASTYSSHMKHSPVNEHIGAHLVLSYHRLLCMFNFESCIAETYSESGLSELVFPVIKIAYAIGEYGAPIQVIASILASPMLMAIFTVELVVIYPLIALAGCILVGTMRGCGRGNRKAKIT